jgi:hypothetical protein
MSESIERLNQLLDELGPSTEEVVLIEQVAPQAWLLAVGEGDSAIAVRLDEALGMVTLSRELGRPQEATRERIYEALLTYNGLAALHGGVRMALREAEGPVLQEFDVPLRGLELATLRRIVQDFMLKSSAWEEIIESAEPPELEESVSAPAWEALKV